MKSDSLPSGLVTELRAALRSGKGNYGHRLLCGKAAECIEQLQMPHDNVLKLAGKEDGADAIALINALSKKVEAQKREIARLQQRCKWYADSQEALRAKVCRQNDVDERGDA